MWKLLTGTKKPVPNVEYEFKMLYPFEKRKAEAERIIAKYPDKIPIILEKGRGINIPDVTNHKYLISKDITVGQYIFLIRKNIKLDHTQTLYVCVNNKALPNISETLGSLYKKYAEKDMYLYMSYNTELTYG